MCECVDGEKKREEKLWIYKPTHWPIFPPMATASRVFFLSWKLPLTHWTPTNTVKVCRLGLNNADEDYGVVNGGGGGGGGERAKGADTRETTLNPCQRALIFPSNTQEEWKFFLPVFILSGSPRIIVFLSRTRPPAGRAVRNLTRDLKSPNSGPYLEPRIKSKIFRVFSGRKLVGAAPGKEWKKLSWPHSLI